ncbi:BA75_03017T0 [Komagataella pastoris]|uniref:BA75_03017T0 n=1 Tax=Komagataella pastoris TaxID=4922 RepID=A0A1B2JB30_PICPA|nr:BA75_03017T0 [Komagataella pastoris]
MSSLDKSIEFILPQLDPIAKTDPNQRNVLIIGVSGPQGSGKSYLTQHVVAQLSSIHTSMNIVGMSMDDFYLTRRAQQELSDKNPSNRLISGRGLPGTHDLPLLIDVLNRIIQRATNWQIPRYDKSLFNGLGDRAPESEWLVIDNSPIDVVVFEGWFNSFTPFDDESELLDRWRKIVEVSPGFVGIEREDVIFLNNELKRYLPVWNTFDTQIVLKTNSVENVRTWRLEQEHKLIAEKGMGMTDEQVQAFIDRYMPAYYLYYEKLLNINSICVGKTLKLDISLTRQVLGSTLM